MQAGSERISCHAGYQRMPVFILKRLLWMLPTLFGISFMTFLLLDLAPGDQATSAIQSSAGGVQAGDAQLRAERLQRLRTNLGLLDESGEPVSLFRRYGRWLQHAVRLDFAGASGQPLHLTGKIVSALPVTLLLNGLALLLALVLAIPMAAHFGMHRGSLGDSAASVFTLVWYGVPEFLLATLLVLLFGGGFFAELLPVVGLASADAASMSPWQRLLDLAAHLCLPVLTLAGGYGVVVFRFLRDSVGRAAQSDFILSLRALGASPRTLRRRALRNGLSPLATLFGTMLPSLVTGTVVVEGIFSLPGLGQLSLQAVQKQDFPLLMTLTMLVSVVTLLGLLLSDIIHRLLDPRVVLR